MTRQRSALHRLATGGAALAALVFVTASAVAQPQKIQRRIAASVSPAPARLSGALRRAQRLARKAGAAGTQTSSSARSAAIESMGRTIAVRDSERGPIVTFKAILETGSAAEVEGLRSAGATIRGHVGRVVSLEAPLAAAGSLAAARGVRSLDVAHRMKPELDVSGPAIGADFVRDPANFGATGSGVVVADIDTGQDLKHLDFRTATKNTRFKSVFNMDPSCRGTPPMGHTLGCFFDETRINKYLRGKTSVSYSDPASTFGHGTHTMGIAAGNGLATNKKLPAGTFTGIAPGADLIGVRVFDALGNQVGDIPEALQFLAEEQARLGNPPMVVNLSLGHQFGAHDGTDPDELAIDDFINDPNAPASRAVVKSAGNSALDDIYLTDTVTSTSAVTRSFTVPTLSDPNSGTTCGVQAGNGNDIFLVDMWYPGTSTVTVRLTAPNGNDLFQNSTGNSPSSVDVDTLSGSIFVDCPSLPYSENGMRECVLGVDDAAGIAPAAGTWTLTVQAISVPMSGARIDAWIALAQKGSCFWGWNNPDAGHNISIPGNSKDVLTVGAYVTKRTWTNFVGDEIGYQNPIPTLLEIADFSSEGPTLDGRVKPEITAPGQGIASARARTVSVGPGSEGRLRSVQDKKHMVLEGTSMSAPHLTGAMALLLSIDATLEADDLRALITGNADVDTATGGVPNSVWGYGKLNVRQAAQAIPAAKRGPRP